MPSFELSASDDKISTYLTLLVTSNSIDQEVQISERNVSNYFVVLLCFTEINGKMKGRIQCNAVIATRN